MKVVGNGRVTETLEKDEVPHQPESSPDWQESVVLFAWAPKERCHFFFRIGHEPNFGPGGMAVVFTNIWADGEFYRNCVEVPLRAEDKFANGCTGSVARYEYKDGDHHWTINDGEVSASLVMKDYMPAFDFFPSNHNLGEVASHHIEGVGYISGTITVKGRTIRIEKGIGHRDRSWGTRKWEDIRGHRWAPAIFGEDFMTHALGMQAPDGSLRQFGYVYRDGTFYIPREVSIVAHVTADGVSTTGGVVNFVMEDGEKLEVTYRNLVPGSLALHRGYLCNDAPAVVVCGDRVGSGIMEYANQLTRSGEAARQEALVTSYIDNGTFSYPPVD